MTELTQAYARRASYLIVGLLLGLSAIYIARGVDWRALRNPWSPNAPIKRVQPRAQPLSPAVLAAAPQRFEAVTPQQAVLLNAEVPFSTAPNPAAAPFVLPAVSPVDRARAVTCLAEAIYFEAGNQGPTGEAAVAQVVLNRMRHQFYPKTVCGVVFQGSTLPTGCQFSFTCDGSLSRRPSDAGWKDAVYVARQALNGHVEKDVGQATHYHTVWVVPYWQSTVVKVVQLGAHIFYRWNNGSQNGQYAGGEFEPPLPAGLDPKSLMLEAPIVDAIVAPKTTTAPSGEQVVVDAITPAAQQVQAAQATKLTTMTSAPVLGPSVPDGYFGRPQPMQRLPGL